MKVYVVNGVIEHEAGDTQGVYSSEEKAKDAIKELEAARHLYDKFEIEEFELDA